MIIFVPVRMELRGVGSVGSFRSLDPWNENEEATFTIEELQMVHARSRWGKPKSPKRQPKWLAGQSFYGIKSEIDGKLRVLPEFLTEMWKEKKIPAEALPKLFQAVEPQLNENDFKLFLRASRRTAAILFGIFGFLALITVGMYFLKNPSAMKGQRPPALQLSVQEWLKRSLEPGQAYTATGQDHIAVSSRAEWRTPVRIPSGVFTYRPIQEGYRLGWIQTGYRDRLLLLSEVRRYDLDHGGRFANFWGIAFRPEDVGIPNTILAELQHENPNLETGLVFCEEWSWGNAGMPPGMFLYIAGMWLVIGTVCSLMIWIIFYPRQRRRYRHMAWATTYLKGATV